MSKDKENLLLDPDKTVVSVKLLWAAIATTATVCVVIMNLCFEIRQMRQEMRQLVSGGQLQTWSDDLRESNPGLKVPRLPAKQNATANFSPIAIASTRIILEKE